MQGGSESEDYGGHRDLGSNGHVPVLIVVIVSRVYTFVFIQLKYMQYTGVGYDPIWLFLKPRFRYQPMAKAS